MYIFIPQPHDEHLQFASVHMDDQFQEGKASVPQVHLEN